MSTAPAMSCASPTTSMSRGMEPSAASRLARAGASSSTIARRSMFIQELDTHAQDHGGAFRAACGIAFVTDLHGLACGRHLIEKCDALAYQVHAHGAAVAPRRPLGGGKTAHAIVAHLDMQHTAGTVHQHINMPLAR